MAPDVMEAAKAAIEALGYGPVLLTRLAASRGHDDAVVLRPMPTADAVRHMDGTRRVGYVLQVIVKDTSEAKAGSFTVAFTQSLVREAEDHPELVAITAAMPGSTGLLPFQERFPERFVGR